MMAFRSGSSIAPQRAISDSVRPQPMQCPVWPLTAQTLMQGVETGGVCMARALAKRLKSSLQIVPLAECIEFR